MLNHVRITIQRISLSISLLMICLLMVSCQTGSVKDHNEKPVTGPLPQYEIQKKETENNTAPQKKSEVEKIIHQDLNFQNTELTAFTDIHYTGQYCNECHDMTPAPGGPLYLKFGGDYDQLCRCHVISTGDYIHPVNVTPSPAKKERIPEEFPLQDGKLTCLTCHDIYRQCQKRLFDKVSLRGSPYPKRTDLCYKCHAGKDFEQVDPHIQLSEDGELLIGTCLICHKEKPDEKHATFKDVTFIGEIEMMCRRCHHIAGNHSGNADHMGIIPSADGLRRIKAMEEKHSVRLPLDEKGKMTCITCHNPHSKGVLPDGSPGARGAGSKYRQRMPSNLCKDCHEM